MCWRRGCVKVTAFSRVLTGVVSVVPCVGSSQACTTANANALSSPALLLRRTQVRETQHQYGARELQAA